jgi:hypothetical protein
VSDVIKIDKELKKRIEDFIKKEDNRIEFPSVKNFVDKAVLRYLNEVDNGKS